METEYLSVNSKNITQKNKNKQTTV